MYGTVQEIIQKLQDNYNPEERLFVDIWGAEDVKCVNDDFELTESLTQEQCEKVLWSLDNYYDASEGVCWDTVNYHLGEVLNELCRRD